ncbi:MAG TPA: putative sulfate exporter family transporter [Thermoanaerobaculia bacterium]|nr:putative sulfate exporter family transporter [Thermoanaerobaculia bacterium]
MNAPVPKTAVPGAPRAAAFVAAAAALVFCLTPWASPPLALALGGVLALTLENPLPAASRTAARSLLQISVVLLGFSMDLPTVLRAGASGMIFAAATIAATMGLGLLVRRLLAVDRTTSLLVSAGTAICGGSAIAAVGSVIGAAESEMSVAIGTVFLLNGAALYLFPPLGHLLHLTQQQFGTWAGVAIHDISSVVGASSVYGLAALQRATAVKLSRALWIVPLTMAAAAFHRRRDPGARRARVPIPWFIGLFVAASLVRSFSAPIAAASPKIASVARIGMTVTLFLIGAGLSRRALRAVGWRTLVQGILLWIAIAAGSLLVVMRSV